MKKNNTDSESYFTLNKIEIYLESKDLKFKEETWKHAILVIQYSYLVDYEIRLIDFKKQIFSKYRVLHIDPNKHSRYRYSKNLFPRFFEKKLFKVEIQWPHEYSSCTDKISLIHINLHFKEHKHKS